MLSVRVGDAAHAIPPSMLAAIRSAAVLGVEAYDVTVEVGATLGLPQWTIVGLAVGAVKEAKKRVAAALTNAGFLVPPRRYTINIAAADQRKDGAIFDLPIALGVLVATGQLEAGAVAGIAALGELVLHGAVCGVRGTLPIALHLATPRGTAAARDSPAGPITLVVPPANLGEARVVGTLSSVAAPTLRALVLALRDGDEPPHSLLRALPDPPPTDGMPAKSLLAQEDRLDLRDVVGQESAKRALEIAAAGEHTLLLVGSPGGGKTMLARRLAGILPPLSEMESLEVMAVH